GAPGTHFSPHRVRRRGGGCFSQRRAHGGGAVTIVLNGRESDLSAGQTLAAALERLGVCAQRRGVAVAVDGEVVPRAQWATFTLSEHARVEVLTAMQGG